MSARQIQAVVMGCSAGGLRALQVVLGGLQADCALPIVIVCHTASVELDDLCSLLARRARRPVIEAPERAQPQRGHVYLAPSGYHLYIENNQRFALSVDERVCFSRPSIDVLFESAADAYGSGLVSVLMTGANDDGAAGTRAVRRRGGLAIVQDPEDAEVSTMPEAALLLAGADYCVPLNRIAAIISRLSVISPH